MRKIAVWCRNLDNIIGYNNTIPWFIASDLERFKRITLNKWLIVGRSTYESFPKKTLPNRNILVLTNNKTYKVTDSTKDFIVNSLENFEKIAFEKYNIDELYISGGSNVYLLFLKNPELKADYVVDSLYQHNIKDHDKNSGYTYINECVDILEREYDRIFINEFDDIKTYIWTKKTNKIDIDKDPTFVKLKTKILEGN